MRHTEAGLSTVDVEHVDGVVALDWCAGGDLAPRVMTLSPSASCSPRVDLLVCTNFTARTFSLTVTSRAPGLPALLVSGSAAAVPSAASAAAAVARTDLLMWVLPVDFTWTSQP